MRGGGVESTTLRIGSSLSWDGSLATVVEMSGDAVVLRDANRRLRRVRYGELLVPRAEGGRAVLIADIPGGAAESLTLAWEALSEAEREDVQARAEHVREIKTGYQSGFAEYAREGEPRPEYSTGVSKTSRYRSKARELGVSEDTIRRWVARYNQADEIGLVDKRRAKATDALGSIDAQWVDMARALMLEQVNEPRVPRNVIMMRIAARLEAVHGAGVVQIPSRSSQYRALAELDKGRSTFAGSTKSKRSIANRPQGMLGRLAATRPGEYVLLDTTRLDVFGLDPISGRWMNSELTVAMDLYTRSIAGLRVAPTTRSLDVAGVLLEAMNPFEVKQDPDATQAWPYSGLPDTLVVRDDRIDVSRFRRAMLPETIVIDHGKPFISEHIFSACARLGVSIQPARVYTPTDKAPVERFFRTIRELLAQLPGFKGEDVTARGRDPESDAVYTIPQLEQIIREWIAAVYHVRPHRELSDPLLPGMRMSPQQKYEQGIARAGVLRVPYDRNVVLEMLPVITRSFNHYGVTNEGLRYRGPIVAKYRNRSQRADTDSRRDWPFFVNPDDLRFIYFHDPEDGSWHTLTWEGVDQYDMPFTLDALEYAKRLAVSDPDRPDTQAALKVLLERWGAGVQLTAKERRASARQAATTREEAADGVTSLRENQRLVGREADLIHLRAELDGPRRSVSEADGSPESGDDDIDEELDSNELDSAYYASAIEDL